MGGIHQKIEVPLVVRAALWCKIGCCWVYRSLAYPRRRFLRSSKTSTGPRAMHADLRGREYAPAGRMDGLWWNATCDSSLDATCL